MAKGDVNGYRCRDCGLVTVTVDRDDGVTPFMIQCQLGCRAPAYSLWYPKPTPSHWPSPMFEWYRPSKQQLRKMSPEMQEHVKRGGLDMRSIHGRR